MASYFFQKQIDSDRLSFEITSVPALSARGFDCVFTSDLDITIVFQQALITEEVATLTNIVNNHVPNPLIPIGASADLFKSVVVLQSGTVYTAKDTDDVILVASGWQTSVNLPTAVGKVGKTYLIKLCDANSFNVIPFGTETIDGVVGNLTLQYLESVYLVSDGTNWIKIGFDLYNHIRFKWTQGGDYTSSQQSLGCTSNQQLNLIQNSTARLQMLTTGVVNIPGTLVANPVLGIANYSASENVTRTTTSTSYVTMTNMTLTPGEGTYLAMFSADYLSSAATQQLTYAIHVNGIRNAGSTRINRTSSTSIRANLQTFAVVTVAAAQAIDIRWLVSTGTATSYGHSLSLLRLS